MALRIRRGPTSDRTGVVFQEGELIFDTNLKEVFIGDGVTEGGLPVTAFTAEEARDSVAAILAAGNHTNITFTYVDDGDNAGRIDAAVNLSNYAGTISAGSFKGSVFGDDSTLLVDAVNGIVPAEVVSGTFTGSVTGNVLGNLTGDVTGNVDGNVTGDVTGNVTGNVVATDTTVLINGTTKQIGYSGATLAGDLVGSVTGNVITSSIDSSDSSAITVTPSLVLSSNLTVDNTSNFGDANFTGNVLFDLSTNQPVVIDLLDVSTVSAAPAVLSLNVRAQNNLSSGPAIDFTTGPSDPGGEPKVNLAQIVAKQESASGGIELKTWNPTSSTFVTGVGVLPEFVFFNANRLALNNTAFFTHSEEFPTVTTNTADITLYPETNQVIVYADVLPGLEDDGLGSPVPSGTYNLGSSTAKFNNAYLEGGLVTTAPTTSAGKAGDVAGAVAFDGSYVYRCTADYTDGLSAIWTRAPLTFSSF